MKPTIAAATFTTFASLLLKEAFAMVDMLADDSDAKKHRDLRRTEIERSEANVVKVAAAIVGFINPFEMEQKDKLYCISSGASVTSEIAAQITMFLCVRIVRQHINHGESFLHKLYCFMVCLHPSLICVIITKQTRQTCTATSSTSM
jgi:hypothetical protein